MLGWLENLPADEVPDENIWHHSERLHEWFAAVKQRRETGQKPIADDAEDVEMMRNALVDEYLGPRDTDEWS